MQIAQAFRLFRHMDHAGDRHAGAHRTELALLAALDVGVTRNQGRHLRPVHRQRRPDERRFIAADLSKIVIEQTVGHRFQLGYRRLFEIFQHRQRLAAHLRLQFRNQRVQQALPVRIARQGADIQRRFTQTIALHQPGVHVHLQRMIVEDDLLSLRNHRGKAQVIAQRIFFRQLAQTASAAAVKVLQTWKQQRRNGFWGWLIASLQRGLRDDANSHRLSC